MKGDTGTTAPILGNTSLSGMKRRRAKSNTRLRPLVFSILAMFGVFGGISSLFVGIVCVIIHGTISQDVVFNQVGTGLLIVAIPMILLGSIFLDEIEGKK
ncbi:MAG: hypothetical protein IPI64_15185 [Chloracidobacterium sp.]|nr:hypothetical protein [Chloracidobacterium sp.]